MIITGVANTGGRIASLNRLARCSGWTRRLKEPLAPRGICLMAYPHKAAVTNPSKVPTHTETASSAIPLRAVLDDSRGPDFLIGFQEGSNSSIPTAGVDRFEDRAARHMIFH